jgi:hypothetical protein
MSRGTREVSSVEKNVVLSCQTTNIAAHLPTWQRKEGKPPPMKYIAIIALAAMALSLGACASKSSTSTASTTASTGYKK